MANPHKTPVYEIQLGIRRDLASMFAATVTMTNNRITSFDRDERGMETLQVVLIIAVAAIILALIVNKWEDIRTWAVEAIDAVTEFKTGD